MARLQPIATVKEAELFRQIVRPTLLGELGVIEPRIAARAAEALAAWFQDVIRETMKDSRLQDRNGIVLQQLLMGARVTGKSSLASLQGAVWAYPYLAAHEFGAEIRPKNGEWMALPIYWALRPDGTPIFRNPRSWNRYGSFVYTQKATGRKFLAYKNKGGTLRILYILKDLVEMPATLGLNAHIQANLGSLMQMWGQIYVEETMAAERTPLDFWGYRPT